MKSNEAKPLKNEKVIFHPNSRYNYHLIFKDNDGKVYLQSYKKRGLKPKVTDIIYTVTNDTQYRPDLISSKFYGTSLLWWAICQVNDIAFPLDRESGLYVGKVIRIPDISTIYNTSV